jgi:hypothetical protein
VSVLVTNKSSIRNRTTRHVASQILQHLVGRGCGWLWFRMIRLSDEVMSARITST